ncbi:hypothetical protein Z154_000804 [Salmonella enterica subsp. enterica]|nr:hypothetical protein [Salmonella enterica subsp. enterica]
MSEKKNTTPFSQQLAYINKGTLDLELLAEYQKGVDFLTDALKQERAA